MRKTGIIRDLPVLIPRNSTNDWRWRSSLRTSRPPNPFHMKRVGMIESAGTFLCIFKSSKPFHMKLIGAKTCAYDAYQPFCQRNLLRKSDDCHGWLASAEVPTQIPIKYASSEHRSQIVAGTVWHNIYKPILSNQFREWRSDSIIFLHGESGVYLFFPAPVLTAEHSGAKHIYHI